jgi:hypothetical protein
MNTSVHKKATESLDMGLEVPVVQTIKTNTEHGFHHLDK